MLSAELRGLGLIPGASIFWAEKGLFDLTTSRRLNERQMFWFVSGHGRKHVHDDWVILEAVDETMRPMRDGTTSATVLLTVLANDVQPIIRYDLGDRLRFYTDPYPL